MKDIKVKLDYYDCKRWSSLDASNCRTKIELFSAWERLVREAQDCTNFLEDSVEELTGPLSSDFKSFGSGSEDGSTRSAVIHQLENLHFLSLSKSLQHPPDLNFRPARIFSQSDKLSQAWISALPGALSHIPSLEFSEIMASFLALPSPSCSSLVGTRLRVSGRLVDLYGDNIMCERLPFDTWRIRHDQAKVVLEEIASDAGVIVQPEVYGLFSHLIPSVATEQGESLAVVPR